MDTPLISRYFHVPKIGAKQGCSAVTYVGKVASAIILLILIFVTPSVVYALTQAFTFTGTGGGGGGAVACTHGPQAPSIPAPAQKAGFTTCLMNADWQSTTTDSFGTNFSNLATVFVQCGASTASDNTYWDLSFFVRPYGYTNNAPCSSTGGASRVAIVTDPVTNTRALDQTYLTTDLSNFNGTFSVFHWPAAYVGGNQGQSGGPNGGQGLWNPSYVQITFRYPAAVLSFPGAGILHDWWIEQAGYSAPTDLEVDFFEIQPAFGRGSGSYQLQTNVNGANNPFSNPTVSPSDNSYHTLGVLTTANGSNMAVCAYLDGGIATATPTACATVPATTADVSGYHGVVLTNWVGNCEPGGQCISQNSDMYIRDIQAWYCSTPWNGPCFGTIVNSALEKNEEYNFAERLINWIFPKALADGFDPPYHETWICPGGEQGVHGKCRPPEFEGQKWWSSCVQGRSDCTQTTDAFLGWDGFGHAVRGTGFCYAKQPYTCSPDGKLP